MKTKEQILAEHPLDARFSAAAELLWDSGLTEEELGIANEYEDCVFTVEEFLQDWENILYDSGADSFGFYHDGEQLTDEPVITVSDDIRRFIGIYPYIVWRFIT